MDKEQALSIATTVLHEEANAVIAVAKELNGSSSKPPSLNDGGSRFV